MQKKKKRTKKEIYKSAYYELCKNIFKLMVMILIICEFSYEILYESSIHLFFMGKEIMGEPLPVAGEALPWKLNRFGPVCSHVSLFTVLIVSFLFFKVWLRAGNILFF